MFRLFGILYAVSRRTEATVEFAAIKQCDLDSSFVSVSRLSTYDLIHVRLGSLLSTYVWYLRAWLVTLDFQLTRNTWLLTSNDRQIIVKNWRFTIDSFFAAFSHILYFSQIPRFVDIVTKIPHVKVFITSSLSPGTLKERVVNIKETLSCFLSVAFKKYAFSGDS